MSTLRSSSSDSAAREEIKLKAFSPVDLGYVADKDFEVTFDNLQYGFYRSGWQIALSKLMREKNVSDYKMILKGVHGQFKRGEIMAIMGPSAAGKSILLECLAGKRVSGLTGSITCRNYSRIKIAFIPQNDKVFGALTVREAIIFASKLQNFNAPTSTAPTMSSYDDGEAGVPETDNASAISVNASEDEARFDWNDPDFHSNMAITIMEQLGLTVCADTRINSCSGGQQKRISIAMELVSRPSILLLDEPTSGLDSSACQAVIELLKGVARGDGGTPKVAIVLSIHQPSWRVFSLFDSIYMMSKETGTCVYEGPPDVVPQVMGEVGLECPEFYNPADYLMEVACACMGKKVVQVLSKRHDEEFKARFDSKAICERLADLERPPNFPFFAHLYLLTLRAFILSLRDPWLLTLRFLAHVLVPCVLYAVFQDSGTADGCPPRISGEPGALERVQVHMREDYLGTWANASLMFYTMIFLSFTAIMPSVLSFPLECNAIVKEVFNNWYGVTPYYLGKMIADLPFIIVFPAVFGTIHYYLNEEYDNEFWRVCAYNAVLIVLSLVSQGQGVAISVIFVDNPSAGVYATPVSMVPSLLLAGFFIHISHMSEFFVALSYTGFMRFGVECMLLIVYGYGRCGENLNQILIDARQSLQDWMMEMMGLDKDYSAPVHGPSRAVRNASAASGGISFDPRAAASSFSKGLVMQMLGNYAGDDGEVRSRILNDYNVSEDDMWPNISILIVQALFLRVFSYILLYRRVKSRN